MKLINKLFEGLEFILNLSLRGGRPLFGMSKFLHPMTIKPFLLPIKGKTLKIAFLININNNIINISFDIPNHRQYFLLRLLNLPGLNLTSLNTFNAFLFNGLEMFASHIFDVFD